MVDAIFGWFDFSLRGAGGSGDDPEGVLSLLEARHRERHDLPGFTVVLARSGETAGPGSPVVARDDRRGILLAMAGEIDNGSEIAERAGSAAGPRDVDRLLELYAREGAGFLSGAHGIFAALVYEARSRRLLLCADRSGGIRAFYHRQDGRRIRFGTCVRAILGQRGVDRETDPEALPELFTLGYPIAPRTLFRGIEVLPGGTFLECRSGGAKPRRYARRTIRPASGESGDEGRRYVEALSAAVERCVSAPRSGVMLSGGVDSAAILALSRARGLPLLRTYSLHVEEPSRSERSGTAATAAFFGAAHHELAAPGPEGFDDLPETIWHFESAGQDLLPGWRLARGLRDSGVEAAVGGYGNDLVWGVCPDRPVGRWFSTPKSAARAFLAFRRRVSIEQVGRLLAGNGGREADLIGSAARFAARGSRPAALIGIDDALFGDQFVYRELGKLAVDAHGLRILLPYHDARVTAIVDALPAEAKWTRSADGAIVLKRFFRDVMARHGILPEEILRRPKRWMQTPTAAWLRRDSRFRTLVRRLVSSAGGRGFFVPAEIERLWEEHLSGAADHAILLMTIAGFEVWQRIFIDPVELCRPSAALEELVA